MQLDDNGAPLRLGLVGAGVLSTRRIYPCLSSLPVSLAAVCDLDRPRAEQAARRFGGEAVYTDYQEMLASARLDAVVVCVDPAQHHRLAMDVMQAGLPVYTEKPPAVNAADAYEMLAASRGTGKICMTAFKKRFAPAYLKAKVALSEMAFGAPTLLSIDYCCGPTYRNDPADPRSQFLLDFCIHAIDLARFLFGDVAEVLARQHGESAYAVTLLFRNGALGTLSFSSNRAWDASCEKVELTGGPGQFITCSNSVEMTQYATPPEGGPAQIRSWHSPSFSTAGADSLRETGFLGELEEFVACVRERREPESSISSAAETMRLYEAIAQAARTGTPVILDWPGAVPA